MEIKNREMSLDEIRNYQTYPQMYKGKRKLCAPVYNNKSSEELEREFFKKYGIDI